MASCHVIVGEEIFIHEFDGEPHITLTFKAGEKVYNPRAR